MSTHYSIADYFFPESPTPRGETKHSVPRLHVGDSGANFNNLTSNFITYVLHREFYLYRPTCKCTLSI